MKVSATDWLQQQQQQQQQERPSRSDGPHTTTPTCAPPTVASLDGQGTLAWRKVERSGLKHALACLESLACSNSHAPPVSPRPHCPIREPPPPSSVKQLLQPGLQVGRADLEVLGGVLDKGVRASQRFVSSGERFVKSRVRGEKKGGGGDKGEVSEIFYQTVSTRTLQQRRCMPAKRSTQRRQILRSRRTHSLRSFRDA